MIVRSGECIPQEVRVQTLGHALWRLHQNLPEPQLECEPCELAVGQLPQNLLQALAAVWVP